MSVKEMAGVVQNPNCDGAYCLSEQGEVRSLPYVGGNLILCRNCYQREINWRKASGNYSDQLPSWESLTVYDGK